MATLQPPFQADSMDQLAQRVVKGQFQKVRYSSDLQKVISYMLSVKPRDRPSVQQILNMSEVKRNIGQTKMKELESFRISTSSDELLGTIRLPRGGTHNLHKIKEKLPKPNYEFKRYSSESSR